jgi:hypothetical protein
MPANYQLAIYRGDTQMWQFRFWQDEEKTLPSDLTGVVAASELRLGDNKATLVVAMTCEVVQPNIVNMSLPATDAKKVTTGITQWDLQLTYPDGVVWTPVAGSVKVSNDATQ